MTFIKRLQDAVESFKVHDPEVSIQPRALDMDGLKIMTGSEVADSYPSFTIQFKVAIYKENPQDVIPFDIRLNVPNPKSSEREVLLYTSDGLPIRAFSEVERLCRHLQGAVKEPE